MLLSQEPPGGLSIGTVARMAGCSVQQLRRYHEQGWVVPSLGGGDGSGDPHRRYTREDVQRARLLSALRDTGMPVRRAGQVVVDHDRQAALDHLSAIEHAAGVLRDLLPQTRPGWVYPTEMEEETVLVAAAGCPDGPDLDSALGALQARVASDRGAGVLDLPRVAGRPDGLPEGPSISGSWWEGRLHDPCLEFPWDGQPAVAGLRVRRVWRAPVLVCLLRGEIPVEEAHAMLDETVLQGGYASGGHRRLYSPSLVCEAVVVPAAPTGTLG